MDTEGYPAYRRLAGGGHYYRILDPLRFEELQRVGTRWLHHEVDARAYPEQVRVREMLAMLEPFEPLEEEEWDRVRQLASGPR